MDRGSVIWRYLLQEKKCAQMVGEVLFQKVTRYDDILTEFMHWLECRDYDVEEPIAVEGYSAQAIADLNPDLDGIGAFNFLVDLREYPKQALKAMKDGFRTIG